MRHYHLTNNLYWRPVINVDKLWSLVPAEEKKDLTADSDVVPVIDTLRHGYGKVLGNGKCVAGISVSRVDSYKLIIGSPTFLSSSRHDSFLLLPSASPPSSPSNRYLYLSRKKIKEAGGVVKLIA